MDLDHPASSGATPDSERPALPPELTETRIVAIARANRPDHVIRAANVLIDAGITCLEIALTTPSATEVIASLNETAGDRACIGAGTVLSSTQASACIDAGARFLVSPTIAPEVVACGVAAGIPCLPGALTPSEIVSAWLNGAAAVKLFPASMGGAAYVHDVRAPLPNVPLIPTGGVGFANAASFMAAGAIALGVGQSLFGDALDGGDLRELESRARALLAIVRS